MNASRLCTVYFKRLYSVCALSEMDTGECTISESNRKVVSYRTIDQAEVVSFLANLNTGSKNY